MKKLHMIGLILATAALLAQSAYAAERGGLYLSLGAGLNNRSNADDELAEARFNDGQIITGAIGYRFENASCKILKNMRMELEYSRQYSDLDKLYLHPTPAIHRLEKADGSIDHEAIQGVFYYDVPLSGRLKPYAGIGFGFGRSILKGLNTSTLSGLYGYPVNTTTGWELAWSPRVGVSYEIGKHFDIFVTGRYYKVTNVVVETPNGAGNLNQVTHPPVEIRSEEIGLRYSF